MKAAIRTVIDAVHGEDNGTPYHWRVYWEITLVGSTDGQAVRSKERIAEGQSVSKNGAEAVASLWRTCALQVGPDGQINPYLIGEGRKWQYRTKTPHSTVSASIN